MSAILGKGLSLKGCRVVEARCDIIDGAVPDVLFFCMYAICVVRVHACV